MIYLDTSVVAAFYWQEPLTDRVTAMLIDEPELGLSQLVEGELLSALSRRVRMGEIAQAQARVIAEQFQAHLEDGFYSQIQIESAHYDLARSWIGEFNSALRTLDALHLAIAALSEIPLITADERLAEGAELFGVAVNLLRPTDAESPL